MASDSTSDLDGFGTQIGAGEVLVSRWAKKAAPNSSSTGSSRARRPSSDRPAATGQSSETGESRHAIQGSKPTQSVNEDKLHSHDGKSGQKLASRWASTATARPTAPKAHNNHHEVHNKAENANTAGSSSRRRNSRGAKHVDAEGWDLHRHENHHHEAHKHKETRHVPQGFADNHERKEESNRSKGGRRSRGRRASNGKPEKVRDAHSLDIGDAIRSHKTSKASPVPSNPTAPPSGKVDPTSLKTWEDILGPKESWADMEEDYFPAANSR